MLCQKNSIAKMSSRMTVQSKAMPGKNCQNCSLKIVAESALSCRDCESKFSSCCEALLNCHSLHTVSLWKRSTSWRLRSPEHLIKLILYFRWRLIVGGVAWGIFFNGVTLLCFACTPFPMMTLFCTWFHVCSCGLDDLMMFLKWRQCPDLLRESLQGLMTVSGYEVVKVRSNGVFRLPCFLTFNTVFERVQLDLSHLKHCLSKRASRRVYSTDAEVL